MNSSGDKQAHESMLIDQNFKILKGKHDTGSEKGIIIMNNSRKLKIKAPNFHEWRSWVKALQLASKVS